MLLPFALALLLGTVLAAVVRTGSWGARTAAFAVLLVVAATAFVPPDVTAEVEPASVALVGTDARALEAIAAAATKANTSTAAPAVVRTVAGDDLRDGLARAALVAGPRLSDRVVVWTGPLRELPAAGGRAAGFAFASTAPLAFGPSDLGFELAAPARAGRPLSLTGFVDVRNAALPAELRVAGPSLEARSSGELGSGRSLSLEAVPAVAGSAEVELAVRAGVHRVARRARLSVGPPEVVLVLDPSGVAEAALAAQGVKVAVAANVPADLSCVSAVVLGAPLPIEAQRVLAQAVQDGLGLFAFGAGLQREGEPLRDVLPVRLMPDAAGGAGARPDPNAEPAEPEPQPEAQPQPSDPQRTDEPEVDPAGPVEVDKHVLAMVLVVDRSGSMGTRVLGGGTKMSYAKTSARQTAAALAEGDQVGLVTFGDDEQARIELPLTSATDRATVERGLDRLAHANERTYLDHGLVTAMTMLKPSAAAVRHVVVLTDGEVWDQELVLRRRAHTMRQLGITLSIVSIVDDRTLGNFQAMAERVAKEGGGLFLPVRDVRAVPQLVSAEVERALDRIGRKPRGNGDGVDPQKPPKPPTEKPKEPDPPKPEPPESTADVDLVVRAVARSPLLRPELVEWPHLRAARPAAARPRAHVLLVAGASGGPVLAFHNVALGRVGAFAADLGGPEAEAFRREPGFPARLSQWVAATRRPEAMPAQLESVADSVEPPAPTPPETAALRALAGTPVLPLSQFAVPPPRTTTGVRSRVPDWALGSAFVLVLLAALERWLVHRGA